MLDVLLENFGGVYHVSEKVGSVLRRGLIFFPAEVLVGAGAGAEGESGGRRGEEGGVVSQLIKRMQTSFEETGYASYLWIMGKVVDKFGDMVLSSTSRGETDGAGRMVGELLGRAFEGVTTSLGRLLERKVAVEIPDGRSFFFLPFPSRPPQPQPQSLGRTKANYPFPLPTPLLYPYLPEKSGKKQCWTITSTSSSHTSSTFRQS